MPIPQKLSAALLKPGSVGFKRSLEAVEELI